MVPALYKLLLTLFKDITGSSMLITMKSSDLVFASDAIHETLRGTQRVNIACHSEKEPSYAC